MSRRCPEDVQKVSRRLEKNVGTSRESSAHVQKASGVLPKVSLSQLKPLVTRVSKSRLHRVSNPVSQSWLMGNEKETLWFADEGLRAFWTFWTFAKACYSTLWTFWTLLKLAKHLLDILDIRR